MTCFSFELFFRLIVIFSLQKSNSFELLEKEYGKVILVNALFRHGERSVRSSYPTDPYGAYKWPDGNGQLLQIGKQRMLEEGEWFKKRYGKLLKTVNSHTNITMLSREQDRTIMSGECFLASFFTPRSDQRLTQNLKWQAVPIHSNLDNIFRVKPDCAMYTLSLEKYFKSKLAKNIFDEYKKVGLFHVLQDYSGFKFLRNNMSDCYDKLAAVYDVLTVQSANNFKLPSWTKKVFPEPLCSAKTKLFVGTLGKLKMKKITAGPLLKSITENMVRMREKKSTQIFHFFSGKDNNIIWLMNALNIIDYSWPPYRSSLVFELREKEGEQFVTIFYKNSTTSDPIYLHLPQCRRKNICSLKTFLKIAGRFIPKDVDLECKIPKK